MKYLRILSLVALVAFGASFSTSEAKAHVDGYAIADGVLGIIGGALAHRGHRHYYYDDEDYYGYSDYPQYVPRYRYYRRYYRPRHRYYGNRHYRRHYRRHHRRHH